MPYKLSTLDYQLLIILIAYLLDLVLGDPQWYWHPVKVIGRLIERLENRLNPIHSKVRGDNKRRCEENKSFSGTISGTILVILVVGATISCVWVILKLAKFIHPIFYYVFCVLLIYFVLSTKALAVEANKVYKDLEAGDIQKAREDLSMIVGRDTKGLNEPEIIRAVVETVAESTMDGIIAPLFYAFLGGPLLAWAYKAINTLDSMVGYRNERFIEFGKASAKLDGLANFIPAKLTCLLISLSSLLCRKNWLNSLKWGSKYLFQGPRINSEATEAAMAGALRIQLGGINFYNSLPVQKNFIGDNLESLEIRHIKESIKLSYLSSVLFMCISISLILLIGATFK